MKIYSDDNKEFKSIEECKAYEADMKLKKEKAEAERKEREQKKQSLFEQIKSETDKINKLLDEYRKSGGAPLWMGSEDGKIFIEEYMSCSEATYNWMNSFWKNLNI